MRALIIIDLQNDFMPGGALGVPRGDEIIPLINRLLHQFDHRIATQDWHPPNHMSFAATHKKKVGERILMDGEEQILWPVHCVQNTYGAELVASLHKEKIEAVFQKGSDPKVDSYSAFFDNQRKRKTGLADYLKKAGVEELYFTGVATDYCVLYSVLDALELGFAAWVIENGCRGVDLIEGDVAKAIQIMRQKGAKIIDF